MPAVGTQKRIPGCKLCQWAEEAARNNLGTVIWESECSIAVVGEHQYFAGYAVVVSKIHVREMHALPSDVAAKMFADVLRLGKAVEQAFKPWKINYASLGNVEEHLHWHVIPRYESEGGDHKDQPWKNAARFGEFKTTHEMVEAVRKKLLSV